MPPGATLWDLVNDERVAIEEITAAVDTYLAHPATRGHPVGPRYVLDLAEAVAAHARLSDVDVSADARSRRIAVRSALLMAKPTAR